MHNYAETYKDICSYNLVNNPLIKLLPLQSFWHTAAWEKAISQR